MHKLQHHRYQFTTQVLFQAMFLRRISDPRNKMVEQVVIAMLKAKSALHVEHHLHCFTHLGTPVLMDMIFVAQEPCIILFMSCAQKN